MGVLTKSDIWKALEQGQSGNGLIVTPLIKKGNEVGSSSIDVHLAHEFIVFKRAKATSISIADSEELKKNIYRYQEKVRIGRGQKFVLHPHQLVLAATLEYISLPLDISGEIGGRSTWGRTGLIIATATKIDPGFKGCVTLELVNAGEIPLVLYPGLCVAQIVLNKTEQKVKYQGRYNYATGPEFTKLDKELESLPKFFQPKSASPNKTSAT